MLYLSLNNPQFHHFQSPNTDDAMYDLCINVASRGYDSRLCLRPPEVTLICEVCLNLDDGFMYFWANHTSVHNLFKYYYLERNTRPWYVS